MTTRRTTGAHGEVCRATVIHRDVVRGVRTTMPPSTTLYDLAEFFRIFGDSTRIGILWALCVSEMCVCDLCALLTMQQSAVSHQLRILKQARLVKCRRAGKVVYYSLDDRHINDILSLGMRHVEE